MATLSDIKKRIGTVKNTQKITKAMKMVAAAKLRRAQSAVIGSRPFSKKLKELVVDIASNSRDNPLFTKRDEVKKVELLVFTSNKGLCGAFNSNLLRRTEAFIRDLDEKHIPYSLNVIGKKGRDYFKARDVKIDSENQEWATKFPFEDANQMVEEVSKRFIAGDFDEYYLVYNEFMSAIKIEPTFQKLFPLEIESQDESYGIDYIYEPSKEELLESLLPRYLSTQVYKAHLESLASELGSRMSAMDNATNNAKDMIGKLTLQYNRARQSSITTELMDIVNGAEALKS